MAVVVQLRDFDDEFSSQVRIPDGDSWETDEAGQLVVWSEQVPSAPRQGVMGQLVAPATVRMLALFAAGTWLYTRWEDPGDGDTADTAG